MQRNKEKPKAVKLTFGSTELGSWITTSEPYWGLSASPIGTLHMFVSTYITKARETALSEVYPENVKAFPDIVGSLLIENAK